MVQKAPSLTLTLEALGGYGALLSSEIKAALTHSLPLKKAEFILPSLTIWGRITALNGRDYIIAESSQNPHMEDSKAHLGTMFFMTQDGVAWADLPASTDEQREIAKNMRGLLRGDTTTKHYWPPKQTEEEESSAEEGEQTKQYKEITELQRLRTMIDSINEATNLAPVGSQIVTADDDIVTNPLFPGLDYPDKLEAYFHRHKGPNGGTAAEDVRGSWAVQYDSLKQVAVCRNLLFLGYSFYYDGSANTWGSFYHGDGLKNVDLVFML